MSCVGIRPGVGVKIAKYPSDIAQLLQGLPGHELADSQESSQDLLFSETRSSNCAILFQRRRIPQALLVGLPTILLQSIGTTSPIPSRNPGATEEAVFRHPAVEGRPCFSRILLSVFSHMPPDSRPTLLIVVPSVDHLMNAVVLGMRTKSPNILEMRSHMSQSSSRSRFVSYRPITFRSSRLCITDIAGM